MKKNILVIIGGRGIGDLIYHLPLLKSLYKTYKKKIFILSNKTNQARQVYKNENYTIFSDPRKENFLLRLWIRKETIKSEPEILSKTLSSNELDLERIKKTLPDSLLDLEKNKSFVLTFQ